MKGRCAAAGLLAAVPIGALLLGGPVLAATAYVTDELRLGVHAAADTSDKAFTSLSSGDAVEVLERNRSYARVRLGDGREGWVRVAFLVDDEPARRRVARLESERDRLAQELTELAASQDGSGERLARAEQARVAAENKLRSAQQELAQLRQANDELRAQLAPGRLSLPVAGFIGALLGLFVAGLALGWWRMDRRIRRLYGGFRPY
jgi:SH3 domain protein